MQLFHIFVVASAVFFSANGQVSVTQAEFEAGVMTNGYPKPTSAQYQGFVNSLSAGTITSKMEAAMFLAQTLHESAGLTTKREWGCSGQNGCADRYPAWSEWVAECQGSNRPSGVSYYGRGYLQLTWCSNYIQASRALGKGDTLKTNPDSVPQTEDLSWGVSAWFWKVNVHSALGGTNEFGRTTKAINGQTQECQGNGQNADKSRQRYAYYTKVFAAFRISGTPNEAGCPY
ncbi:acidic endochitinase SP2 [Folsomia candida]|uniref:Acidic endochitinase SP2 n=1 Tax=Folsomia candida TaxID=158441 RepID=A0A226DG00_FOLCA|nr:acidic endochitinase SP2 [Folsomia candida]OXA44495.1 Acidic endochitinase SP2 [Folsomia candida]